MSSDPEFEKQFVMTCLAMPPSDFIEYVATRTKPHHVPLIKKVLQQAPVNYLEGVKSHLEASPDLKDKWYEILRTNPLDI